jgi:hypothetical protein
MTFDKALLFKDRLPEADVDVPGVGTVRVRALSRADVLGMQAAKVEGEDGGAFERRMLALSLVEPALTEDEIGQWQRASKPGELEAVTAKVNELSSLDKAAAKEAYVEFEQNPDAEFPVLPGAEAGDDGGPDDSGDAQR